VEYKGKNHIPRDCKKGVDRGSFIFWEKGIWKKARGGLIWCLRLMFCSHFSKKGDQGNQKEKGNHARRQENRGSNENGPGKKT